jgi:hypothetical protein
MQTYGDKISRESILTDKKGMASFRPALDATCVITCVFMQRSAVQSESDFESLWASRTLILPKSLICHAIEFGLWGILRR